MHSNDVLEACSQYYQTGLDCLFVTADRTTQNNFSGLSASQFVQEFGTLTIDLGRRTGKTTFIADAVKSEDIVFFRNHSMVKGFQRMLTHRPHTPHIFVLGVYKNIPPIHSNSILYFDDASHMPLKDVLQATARFIQYPTQRVVKVG